MYFENFQIPQIDSKMLLISSSVWVESHRLVSLAPLSQISGAFKGFCELIALEPHCSGLVVWLPIMEGQTLKHSAEFMTRKKMGSGCRHASNDLRDLFLMPQLFKVPTLLNISIPGTKSLAYRPFWACLRYKL